MEERTNVHNVRDDILSLCIKHRQLPADTPMVSTLIVYMIETLVVIFWK